MSRSLLSALLLLSALALVRCSPTPCATGLDGGDSVEDAGPLDAGIVHELDAGACQCPTVCVEPDAGPGPVDAGPPYVDAGPPYVDAGQPVVDAGELPTDGGVVACLVDGNPGQCMDSAACGALPAFTSVAGYCPGPANIECCVLAPATANNPPVPAGWSLMTQANVTAAMTTWAVEILNAPVQYPRFDSALQQFGTLWVMARVEWHPPDFQNGVVHRGVTLYQP